MLKSKTGWIILWTLASRISIFGFGQVDNVAQEAIHSNTSSTQQLKQERFFLSLRTSVTRDNATSSTFDLELFARLPSAHTQTLTRCRRLRAMTNGPLPFRRRGHVTCLHLQKYPITDPTLLPGILTKYSLQTQVFRQGILTALLNTPLLKFQADRYREGYLNSMLFTNLKGRAGGSSGAHVV